MDGSASIDQNIGIKGAGYAVVTQHDTLKAESLPAHLYAQTAELKALRNVQISYGEKSKFLHR